MKRILLITLFVLSTCAIYAQEYQIEGSGIVRRGSSCTYTLLKDGVPQTDVSWTLKVRHSFVTKNDYAYITPAANGKVKVTGTKAGGDVTLYAFPKGVSSDGYPIAFLKTVKVELNYSPYIYLSCGSSQPGSGALMPTAFIENGGDIEKMTVDWYRQDEPTRRAIKIINLWNYYSFELKAIATIEGKKYTLIRKIPVFNAQFSQKQDGPNLRLEVSGFKEAIAYEWQSTATMKLVSASNLPYALYKTTRTEPGPATGKVVVTVSGGLKYPFYAGCYMEQADIDQLNTKALISEPNLSVPTGTEPLVSVKVYSFNTGALVYEEKNAVDFNIKSTSLKDGIYIVVTTNKDGKVKSEKIVKTTN